MKKNIRVLISLMLCVVLLFGNSYIANADPIGSLNPEPINTDYLNYFATEKNVYYDNVGSTYLYIAKEDGLYRSLRSEENYLMYYEADIESSLIVGDHFFYTTPAQPQVINYYNIQTNTTQTVATAAGAVSDMQGNQDVIYFVSGNSLYRLHVASGIIDFILQLPGENYSNYKPISNRIVHIYLYRPDWLEYVAETGDELNEAGRPVLTCYRYNTMTKVGTQISEEEAWEEVYEMVALDTTQLPAELQSFSVPTNFLGELIHPDYPADVQDYSSGTEQNVTYNEPYKSSTQCVAFAKFIYDTVYYPHTVNTTTWSWGNDRGDSEDVDLTSVAQAKTLLYTEIPPGSRVAVREIHQLIIAGYDTNYVWVYHSNMFNDDKVQLHRMTYAQFVTTMKPIRFFYHPDYNHVHTYAYNSGTGCNRYKRCTSCSVRLPNSSSHSYTHVQIDAICHKSTCSSCNRIVYDPHTYSDLYVDGLGMQYRYCTKCNYYQYI